MSSGVKPLLLPKIVTTMLGHLALCWKQKGLDVMEQK